MRSMSECISQLLKGCRKDKRQSAVKYLEDHRKITRAESEKIHLIPERTANRELNELAGKKVIESWVAAGKHIMFWRDLAR